jgi:hypothetical protein
MTDHFPSPQKGRNRLILILIISGFPLLWVLAAILFGERIRFNLYHLVPVIILAFGIWNTIHLFKGKTWARTAWILGCLFVAFLFFILSIGLAFTRTMASPWVAIIPFLLVMLYAVLGVTLYKNYHITAFFNSKATDMLEKIEELGKGDL